jgi:hypothetical protein
MPSTETAKQKNQNTMINDTDTYDLTKVADRVEVEHDLSPAVKTNDVSPTSGKTSPKTPQT